MKLPSKAQDTAHRIPVTTIQVSIGIQSIIRVQGSGFRVQGSGQVAPFLQAGDIDSGGYWRALLRQRWMFCQDEESGYWMLEKMLEA
jgi:hypothetical protein